MSTPSTATALPIANPYSPYNYPHNPHNSASLLLNSTTATTTTTTTAPHHPRLPAATTVHYQAPTPTTQPVHTNGAGGSLHTSAAPATATRARNTMASRAIHPVSRSQRTTNRRATDWNEFYRNGPPQEVIVIHDTPEAEEAAAAAAAGGASSAASGFAQPTNSSMRRAADAPTAARTNGTNAPRHADKKRKVQPSSYEPVYAPAYSTTHTPHLYAHGSPTTVSANSSTASLIGTTAGTSLGSNPSLRENGSSTTANGIKRKRVTRASQAAAAAANTVDAFANYHPPPNPPIKAKDVYVQPVRDVSSFLFHSFPREKSVQDRAAC